MQDSIWTAQHSVPTNPNAEEVIFCTSCYLHDRLVSGESHLRSLRTEGAREAPSAAQLEP